MKFFTREAKIVHNSQFETTFFSGKHLSKQSFDEGFFEHVEQEVRVPDSSDEHENGLFVDPLNMEELNAAIANTSSTRSFDADGIHLSMVKNMGYKTREMLLQIFNNCWETASRLGKESRVLFIRKLNKKRYDDCSSYRPLSISSHFGKLLERILAGRINKYLELHNIIGQEQEGEYEHQHQVPKKVKFANDLLTAARDSSGQGHFVTSNLGNNMASVIWATKVSTKWVDQIDQLTDIFEEVSIFVVWLGRFANFAK